ncbi:MAG: LPS-assembly protein LptD [Nitrospiria bacterium]
MVKFSPSLKPIVFLVLILFYLPPNVIAQNVLNSLGKEPINVAADQLEFFKETETYKASGHLKIVQGERTITGDSLEFNQQTGKMEITGHVLMVEEINQIRADKITMNVKSQTGVIYKGHLIFGPEHFHIDGKEIQKISPKEYEAIDATVTTCECNQYTDKPPSSPWRIRSNLLDIKEDDYVKGRNVFFEIKDIPVLYTPYLYIPMTKERQSGLLIPQLSYNSTYGIGILQPYYWAIARNQDLTVSFDYRSLGGTGSDLEYRYLSSANSGGNLFASYFNDTLTGTDRSEVRLLQTQTFSDHINAHLIFNYVSDSAYFKDLSISTADVSQRSMESDFYLAGRWENQSAYLLTRFTRDLTTTSDLTTQKLPEIGYIYHSSPIFSTPLYFDFSSTATYFYQEAGLRVGRGDAYLRLTDEIPVSHLGILTPQAGLRKTIYSRGINEDTAIERTIPDYGATLDNSWKRVYKAEEPLTHVIESSLKYEFVPLVNQTDIPFMDSYDQIPEKNLFTYSLTNRLIKKEEIFYLKLTDSYLFNPTDEGRLSDIRSEMRYLFYGIKIRTDSFYNMYTGSTDIFNTDVSYNSPGQWNLAVGERFSKSGLIPQKGDVFNPLSLGLLQYQPLPIRNITTTLRIYFTSQLTVATKIYYDTQNGILTEADYGLRYMTRCWGITLGYVQFPTTSQFTFAIDLTGVGGSGNSPFFKALFGF